MKSKMINNCHLEGLLYEHKLTERESGPNSKNPGTKFIMGDISIATDDAITNIVKVHYGYITQKTSTGKDDPRYETLKQIIDGKIKSVMADGEDNATKLRIDTSIGLNDFYSDRSGEMELVSAKRNEGGFIHTNGPWKEDPKDRNIFEVDMLITGMRMQEANPERNITEKGIIKGAIFDFRKALLPVEFSVVNSNAISYFEGLGASASNPVFIKLRGRQISETVITRIEEEGAFGEPYVREVPSSTKDWVIIWAANEPYAWDDEATITAAELKEAMANREVYLATVKKRQDDYNASKSAATTVTQGAFNF